MKLNEKNDRNKKEYNPNRKINAITLNKLNTPKTEVRETEVLIHGFVCGLCSQKQTFVTWFFCNVYMVYVFRWWFW